MVARGTLTGQLYGIKRQAAGCSAPPTKITKATTDLCGLEGLPLRLAVVRCCELRWKGGKRRMQQGIAQSLPDFGRKKAIK